MTGVEKSRFLTETTAILAANLLIVYFKNGLPPADLSSRELTDSGPIPTQALCVCVTVV